jgi:hypothetical protein
MRNIDVRMRVAALNTGASEFVLKTATAACGLYIHAGPKLSHIPSLKSHDIRLDTLNFVFHFRNVGSGEVGLSVVPDLLHLDSSARTDPSAVDVNNGDALSSRFAPGAFLAQCQFSFNPENVASSSAALICTTDQAMLPLVRKLTTEGFPGLPGGTPDARLTVTKVAVSTSDTSCATAKNIRVRLQVTALNDSPDPSFVLQRARVICGLVADPTQVLPPPAAQLVAQQPVKLASMIFDFAFESNVHRDEQAVSAFATGEPNNPATGFTIQGEATADDFVFGATLNNCVEQFNE